MTDKSLNLDSGMQATILQLSAKLKSLENKHTAFVNSCKYSKGENSNQAKCGVQFEVAESSQSLISGTIERLHS